MKSQKKNNDEQDYQVSMFFDDDEQTTTISDFKPKIVIKDHFTKENEFPLRKNSNLSSKQNNSSSSKSINQNQLKSTGAIDKNNDEADGFSEIMEDQEAVRRRQRMMSVTNFVKSEVRSPNNQEDFDTKMRSSEIISRSSSLSSSLLNISSSSTTGTAVSEAINTDLEKYDITIFEEKSFQKGPECSVCKQKFVWFSLRQHHCRFCGLSCCQLCSEKRINKLRSCDACFVKVSLMTNQVIENTHMAAFQNLFEFQKEYESLVNDQNQLLIKQRDHLEETDHNLTSQSWKLSIQAKENALIQEEQLAAKQKSLEVLQSDLAHLKQNVIYLKEVSDSKQQIMEEKRQIFYEIQQKLNRQKEDNLMKMQSHDYKIKKYEMLQEKGAQIQLRNHRINQQSSASSFMSIGSVIDSNHFNAQKNQESEQKVYNPSVDEPQFVQNPPLSEKEKVGRTYSMNPIAENSEFEPKTHNVAPIQKGKGFCVSQCDSS